MQHVSTGWLLHTFSHTVSFLIYTIHSGIQPQIKLIHTACIMYVANTTHGTCGLPNYIWIVLGICIHVHVYTITYIHDVCMWLCMKMKTIVCHAKLGSYHVCFNKYIQLYSTNTNKQILTNKTDDSHIYTHIIQFPFIVYTSFQLFSFCMYMYVLYFCIRIPILYNMYVCTIHTLTSLYVFLYFPCNAL